MPGTVAVGETFTATITTIGPSPCWESDGAEVAVDGLVAQITPWDAVAWDQACAGVLVALPRTVSLRFTEPGQGVIRVFGRRVVGEDVEGATDVVAEEVVEVVGT